MNDKPEKPQPLQFGLRKLFVVTTVAAVVVAILTAAAARDSIPPAWSRAWFGYVLAACVAAVGMVAVPCLAWLAVTGIIKGLARMLRFQDITRSRERPVARLAVDGCCVHSCRTALPADVWSAFVAMVSRVAPQAAISVPPGQHPGEHAPLEWAQSTRPH